MDVRKRRRLVGRLITGIVLLGAAVLIGLGFKPKPVPVNTGKVEKRPLEVTVDESGKTRIRDTYLVSAPVTGNMSRIPLRAGDPIAEGAEITQITPLLPQLLDTRTRAEAAARVDVAGANVKRTRAAISQAEATLEYAKSQAERSEKLRKEGGISEQQYEETQYRLRAAEEDLAAAKLAARVSENELDTAKTALTSVTGGERRSAAGVRVTSPAAGRVLRVLQQSEGAVQAGTPLIEIGDPRRLEIVVDVLTTEAVDITQNAHATIERWGGPYPLAARVKYKEPSAYTTRSALGVEEQRVPVVLDIVDDPSRWTELGDGYRVEARIRTAYVADAIAVPASALFREASAWAAFKVNGSHAHKVPVRVGVRTPDFAQVEKGLAVGDEVVLYPSDQVSDGVAVAER
jgi:HlyD family secretion protein